MSNLKEKFGSYGSASEIIDLIERELYSLKGVIKDDKFDLQESKKTLIETITLIENHVTELRKKI